jgi:hypothetical protein
VEYDQISQPLTIANRNPEQKVNIMAASFIRSQEADKKNFKLLPSNSQHTAGIFSISSTTTRRTERWVLHRKSV